MTEYFLLDAVCQSRLDGRNGSLACTVIATLLIQQVINGDMELPVLGESPSKACLHQFISAMCEGNAMYDSRAMEFGLLNIYDVLALWPNLHLSPVRGYDLGFHNSDQDVEKLSALLHECLYGPQVCGGVLIQQPYTIAHVFGCGTEREGLCSTSTLTIGLQVQLKVLKAHCWPHLVLQQAWRTLHAMSVSLSYVFKTASP